MGNNKDNNNDNNIQKDAWRDKNYSFFCNKACEAFPCHKDVLESEFNCLFCFCPLYFLGDTCGGAFVFTVGGIKDCSNCNIPHKKENFGWVVQRLAAAIEASRKPQEK